MMALISTDPQIIIRRARKEYECKGHGQIARYARTYSAGCTGKIRPGDIYIESQHESRAFSSGSRHCLACGKEEFVECLHDE